MKRKNAQVFLVIPARKAVGLTSVALGLVRTLQRLGVEAGFVKPIAEETPDRSGYFARQIFQMQVPEALLLQATAERIAANQTSALLEEIVGLCMKAGEAADVLVIEGLHADESHSFISQINVDIARSLNAEVIVVADASLDSAFADLRFAIGQFLNSGCNVFRRKYWLQFFDNNIFSLGHVLLLLPVQRNPVQNKRQFHRSWDTWRSARSQPIFFAAKRSCPQP